MSKVPGKVGFEQPMHGKGGTSSAKNKSKVGFKQNPAIGGAGKTTSKKNPGKLGFTQKTGSKTGTSTKKNPGKVGFEQPNRAGKSVKMPAASGGSVLKGSKGKVLPMKNVAPKMGAKFTSTDALVAYRKKKYGA